MDIHSCVRIIQREKTDAQTPFSAEPSWHFNVVAAHFIKPVRLNLIPGNDAPMTDRLHLPIKCVDAINRASTGAVNASITDDDEERVAIMLPNGLVERFRGRLSIQIG